MASNAKSAAHTSLQTLTDTHTDLGLTCGLLARDAQLPWKSRKVFEAFAWEIYEQVKALRTQDLSKVPDAFLDAAEEEVTEALTCTQQAAGSHLAEDAALAAIETHQAIDAVDGILGNKADAA